MQIGYVRISKTDGSQNLDLQKDAFTQRMLAAINGMMSDMLAAVARKDYEDRRRRQLEGIRTAKALSKYKGRQINIAALLKANKTYSEIVSILGCSRSTIAKVTKETALS